MIEGSYTGRDGASTQGDAADANFYRIGTNVPKGAISSSFYVVAYLGALSGNSTYFDRNASNILSFAGSTVPANPILTPLRCEEAWQIDTKLDDGRPAMGTVFGVKTACSTTAVSATAEWAVVNTTDRTGLHFNMK